MQFCFERILEECLISLHDVLLINVVLIVLSLNFTVTIRQIDHVLARVRQLKTRHLVKFLALQNDSLVAHILHQFN